MSAKPKHPPVMPVKRMFYSDRSSGDWLFVYDCEDCHEVVVEISEMSRHHICLRLIISALQRCAWMDEAKRFMALDTDDGVKQSWAAKDNAAAWERWGKEAGE